MNYGKQYLKKLNCVAEDFLTCLRGKTTDKFIKATDSFSGANSGKDLPIPTVDGHFNFCLTNLRCC